MTIRSITQTSSKTTGIATLLLAEKTRLPLAQVTELPLVGATRAPLSRPTMLTLVRVTILQRVLIVVPHLKQAEIIELFTHLRPIYPLKYFCIRQITIHKKLQITLLILFVFYVLS